MEKLATAVLLASNYINERTIETEMDDDIRALEAISAELQGLSSQEKQALIKVAKELNLSSILIDMGL